MRKTNRTIKNINIIYLLSVLIILTGYGCELDNNNEPPAEQPLAAAPSFNPASGTVDEGTNVIISTETDNATIWYTVGDGSQAAPVPGSSLSGTAGSSTASVIIDSDQIIKTVAVSETSSVSEESASEYIITAIFVADTGNDRIVLMNDMEDNSWDLQGTTGDAENQFSLPSDIAADALGRIYIADNWNTRVIRIDDMTGAGWVSITDDGGTGFLTSASSVAVDSRYRIYALDHDNSSVCRFDDMNGTNWTSYDLGMGVVWPNDMAIDSENALYFSTDGSTIIRMDNMSGDNKVEFGSAGSGEHQFTYVTSVDVGSDGRIYTADSGGDRIACFVDMQGTGWQTFGSTGTGINQFSSPTSISIDSSGKIYILDTGNNRVIRIDDITGTNWIELSGTAPTLNGAEGISVR